MTAQVMQLVNDLLLQSKWEEAHALLRKHAQQSPNDPEIEYQLGVLCYNMGNFADAEMHLKTSLSIRFDHADSHYQLGLTLLKEMRPQEAMPEFREACERNQSFAIGHLHWGLALAQMGSLRGALGQFNQAIKLSPMMSSAYYQAGVASHQLGQYIEAAQFFQKACTMDPNLSEPFNALGVTLAAMQSYQDASQCFLKAMQVDPGWAVAPLNMAKILVEQGRPAEALSYYQAAVNTAAKSMSARDRAEVYNDWAVTLVNMRRLEEACEKLLLAVDVDASFVEARINLGLVRSQLSEHDLAVEAFEKAFEAAPESDTVALNLAVTYLLLGRYQEALDRLAPLQSRGAAKPPWLDLWMGYSHLSLGDVTTAVKHFERAANEDPSNYLALDGWGACLGFLGQHREAAEKFQQCLSLNREFAIGHLHLARSLEAIGHADASIMSYREALTRDPACLVPEKEAIELLLKENHFDLVVNKSLKLLEIAPTDPDAKIALARALRAQNRLPDALNLLERLVVEQPQNGAAHVLLGQVFLSQGRFVEADERFRMASTLVDGDSALFFSWGKSLLLLGMHELAIEKFEKASEIDPYDPDTYEAWGSTLKLLGRFGDAAEVYKRASQYI